MFSDLETIVDTCTFFQSLARVTARPHERRETVGPRDGWTDEQVDAFLRYRAAQG